MKYRSNQHHISHARSAKKDQEAICAGKPFPPGATWDGKGVNFALFSENAEKVELCLLQISPQSTDVHQPHASE